MANWKNAFNFLNLNQSDSTERDSIAQYPLEASKWNSAMESRSVIFFKVSVGLIFGNALFFCNKLFSSQIIQNSQNLIFPCCFVFRVLFNY